LPRISGLAVREWCDAELGSGIERVVGFSPRAGQIQAIRKLVIDQKDLILVAPTVSYFIYNSVSLVSSRE
jgi:hypothetical protein